jgi:hypothetical protein
MHPSIDQPILNPYSALEQRKTGASRTNADDDHTEITTPHICTLCNTIINSKARTIKASDHK